MTTIDYKYRKPNGRQFFAMNKTELLRACMALAALISFLAVMEMDYRDEVQAVEYRAATAKAMQLADTIQWGCK